LFLDFLEMFKSKKTTNVRKLEKATTRLLVTNQEHVDRIDKDSRKIEKLEFELMDAHAILDNQMERTSDLRKEHQDLITSVNNFLERSNLKCLCVNQIQCDSSVCKKLKQKEKVKVDPMSETDSSDSD